MTVTIQIGNSDDKLTQQQWHAFVVTVQGAVDRYSRQIHFFGAPAAHEKWQNAAWVIELDEEKRVSLQQYLTEVRRHWGQDSIAWTEGDTQFI